jgi:hypothetical protein
MTVDTRNEKIMLLSICGFCDNRNSAGCTFVGGRGGRGARDDTYKRVP